MADWHHTMRVMLLVFACVVGIIVSLLGLFVGAWGGWGGTVAEFCFWSFPAMSFPVFLFSLWFQLSGLVLSLVIPFGTFFAICAVNIRSCQTGNCTTMDTISIMFGTFTSMYGMWLGLLVMPVCLYFVCLLDTPKTEAR